MNLIYTREIRNLLRKIDIDEDRPADLIVHGGEDKAIYKYPKKD
jgi:MOSC domain-containing protein YiiM